MLVGRRESVGELDEQPHAEPGGPVARRTRGRRPRRFRRCRGGPTACRPRTPRGRTPRRSAEALRLAETFVRSATVPRVRSLYSGWSGRRQASSPVRSAAAAHPLGPLVVVREQSGVGRAERDDDAAGQRRDVDHPVGAQVAHAIRERVGEDQTPLGVGVVHLDGLPVELGDDVAGLGRRAARACSPSPGRRPRCEVAGRARRSRPSPRARRRRRTCPSSSPPSSPRA